MKTIWCLFGVKNEYDQPDNDLWAWWSSKPTLEQLCTLFSVEQNLADGESLVAFVARAGETIIQLKDVVRGRTVRIDGIDYRLQQVEEGKQVENK